MFNAGQDFTVKDEKLGMVLSGKAFNPKTIIFNPQTTSIDINNKWGHKEFSTKRPFTIKMKDIGAGFLIKEPLADNIFATDLSDRELKGYLLVIPNQEGMQLINFTRIEDILPAVLTQFAKGQKNADVLKALAITLRTQMTDALLESQNAVFDLADNTENFYYGGINMQSGGNLEAVKQTANKFLVNRKTKDIVSPEIYQSCSYLTEEGIKNTKQKIDYTFSPLNIFKYMISNPPKDLISAPQDPTQWSRIKWIYMLPLKDMQTRLNFKFKEFFPTKMDNYGRTEDITFKTAKEDKTLPFEKANFILSNATLRSDFFFYIPVNKGQEYLFMGTDTGFGKGLCVDGLINLAKEGKTYLETLKYYYPDLEVSETWQSEKSPL